MAVTIKISEQLLKEARERGVSVEVYVQEILRGKRSVPPAKGVFNRFARP
jgi:hypothetical protein